MRNKCELIKKTVKNQNTMWTSEQACINIKTDEILFCSKQKLLKFYEGITELDFENNSDKVYAYSQEERINFSKASHCV